MLSWRRSNTLPTAFCREAVQEAINRDDTPALFNTDPGCPFPSLDFTGLRKDHGLQISMDENGCCGTTYAWSGSGRASHARRALSTPTTACARQREGARYVTRDNQPRPHASLDDTTPEEFFFANLPALPHTA